MRYDIQISTMLAVYVTLFDFSQCYLPFTKKFEVEFLIKFEILVAFLII